MKEHIIWKMVYWWMKVDGKDENETPGKENGEKLCV